MNKLPQYIVDFTNPDTLMDAIGLVENPAVQYNWFAFDDDHKQFVFADEEQRKIFGVVCLCGVPIYRRDPNGYEYEIIFDAKAIDTMVERFSRAGAFNNINLQHDEHQFVDSVVLTEMFVKDKTKGIDPVQFADVPDHSLFATYKVLDDALWARIKEGREFHGFSLECWCDLKPVGETLMSAQTKEQTIDEYVADLLS